MKDLQKIGKKIAYILRHNPGSIKMDTHGYVRVNDLTFVLNISRFDLDRIVQNDNKGRYSYDESGEYIRANQGHSIPYVNIDFEEKVPPRYLYHGTSPLFVDSIKKIGLIKKDRLHVHLSSDIETAKIVGKRHSKELEPTILIINALDMYNDGNKFYISENGVWLTDYVDPHYIL